MTDLCDQIGWNPIAVGRSHSALAAVIAGFLFTGAILLLGLDSRSERHPKVLGLLASSFFVLLLDSFLFSVVGGEQICNRAWTELMIAAGLLGVGSPGMFGGIAWLLVEKDYSGSPALRLILIIAYSISAIVIFHLQVTALYYLHDVFEPSNPPTWLIATTWASIFVIALCLIGVVLIRRRLRRGAANDVIFRAAYASVAYGIGASVMFGGLGARWNRSATRHRQIRERDLDWDLPSQPVDSAERLP